MSRLDNRVAIITGAGSGIGRAAAILFAKEKAKVVVACRTIETGKETVRMIRGASNEAIFVRTDVSKPDDVKKMIATTIDTYGKLDILINNAGILGETASTTECTEENFDRTIAINLKGVWLGMKYAIPEIIKGGGGSIINIASVAADRGLANLPAYCASKGGVVALSKATAMEFAAKKIRVNCINPAGIATPMFADLPEDFKETVISTIPLHRFAEPEEVAQAALFLASNGCSHMTGHSLVIDGGLEADSHL